MGCLKQTSVFTCLSSLALVSRWRLRDKGLQFQEIHNDWQNEVENETYPWHWLCQRVVHTGYHMSAICHRLADPTPSGTKQPSGSSVTTQREGRNTSSFVTHVYTQMGEGHRHRTPEHILPHNKLLTAVCKQFTWLKETVHTPFHTSSHLTHTLTLIIEEKTVRFEAFVYDSISRIMQGKRNLQIL